jgi:ABC-2 type transport system permease protein
MIRRAFEAVDIDYSQWRALVKSSLKLDFRVGGMSSLIGNRTSRSSYSHLVWVVVFYLFTGLFFGIFVLLNKDVFLTSVIFATYVMFMTGSVVLIEYNSVVISPDDYDVLGYRPISSRTFFAARLANVFFYVGLITTAMVLLPASAYFFTLGFRPSLGVAALAAFYAASFTTALVLVLAYTTILTYVHPNRLRRFLSYVQLSTSFVIYGSYFLVPRLMELDTEALRLSVAAENLAGRASAGMVRQLPAAGTRQPAVGGVGTGPRLAGSWHRPARLFGQASIDPLFSASRGTGSADRGRPRRKA